VGATEARAEAGAYGVAAADMVVGYNEFQFKMSSVVFASASQHAWTGRRSLLL
jgi:hypothetical protein